MIFDEKQECMPIEQRKGEQGENLRRMVAHVYQNVPLCRERFQQAGIAPEDIRSIDDLSKLPFTYKADLRDSYPYGMLAVPKRDVVRLHASSGTTGKRTVVAYTRADVDIWAQVMARTIAGGGGTPDSVVQVAYGYGLFTGGLGAHYGAEKLGAVTVPASVGNTRLQLQLWKDLGVTLICCTPSYALHLAEAMEEAGIGLDDLKLRSGCFGAEPWTQNMRREIEVRLGLKAYDIYGLSEIIGPGVSFECEAQNGLHVNEDHFIPEIIDPETGKNLPAGQYGELVFTCVTKEAMPLVRYRTQDIAMLDESPCACGRTTIRMSKPSGRTDDMLIIRGINVFPSQVESVLLELGEVSPHYQIIVERKGALDTLEVVVEMTPAMFGDTVRQVEAVQQRIQNALASTLGISAAVRLVDPKTIARSEGKAVRVIDKRKL